MTDDLSIFTAIHALGPAVAELVRRLRHEHYNQ
jgi:hypothetical protein